MVDQLIVDSHKGLVLTHLNIRSMWKKIDTVRTTFTNALIDVMGFSETWLTKNFSDSMVDIHGYTIHRLDRSIANENGVVKKGGGIALYVKECIKTVPVSNDSLNTSSNIVECQWIELCFAKHRNIIVGNCYRPPQGSVDLFLEYIEKCIENFDTNRKDIFILGDVNIDCLDKKDDSSKKLLETMTQLGFINMIKTPTRFSDSKNSCIDHLYTNSDVIFKSGVLNVNISDHEMIYTIRKKVKQKSDKSEFSGRSYRNYNSAVFSEALNRLDWTDFYNQENPNNIWRLFYENISKIIEQLCPLKKFKIKKYKEPWVTNELLELIKDKDIALKRAKRTKLDQDWIVARQLRNSCLSQIRQAKRNFIQNQLNEHWNDSKKIWKEINQILPDKATKHQNISLIDQDTGLEIDNDQTADYINTFFTNIGPKLAQNLTEPWHYDGSDSDRHIHDIILTPAEILTFCKEIEIYKSSSVPNLSSRILKDTFLSQIDKVFFLFDKIIKTGIYPDLWKCATVIPLKKGGISTHVTNLRPISLLPLPSKILEKIIHNRMISHLETNNLLDKNQGGFRKNNSTINTAVKFTKDIFNAINIREITIATFIDMAKAFDTVNHEILLKKLEYLGFRGNIYNLLKNYLFQRKQVTLANGITSKQRKVTCGIPQGSTVGPLMFIIYMNDLSTVLKNCNYHLYADDTVIYTNGDLNASTDILCHDLAAFKKWCDRNKLTLNVGKTKYVTFGLKSQTRHIDDHVVSIDNLRIDRVCLYKYLGITLDMNLNYNKHLQNCLKIASHKIYLLSKVRNYITSDAALKIYKTMILPLIEYGDILYDNSNAKLLKKFQTLQSRSLRICSYEPYHVPVIYLHEICNIARLDLRRKMHIILYMYKQKRNYAIINTREVFTRAHDAILYVFDRPNSEKYKNNVLYKGAIEWNSLTVEERQIQTYEIMKSYLKNKIYQQTVPALIQ